MNRMFHELASILAQVRPTEVWSATSMVVAVLLLGAVIAGLVAWIVHVTTRR
jgi:hypothetical protein